MTTRKKSHSSFWLKDEFFPSKQNGSVDLVQLNSVRRSIANFVRIVTGEDIPVIYSSGKESYTDGKQVIISADVNDDNFDPTVGLALHEGSHCLLTDFSILPNLTAHVDSSWYIKQLQTKYGLDAIAANNLYKDRLKNILNIVEDRRIDDYIYTTAPGYQGYYQSLYDKYFNSPVIDKILKSGGAYSSETYDSYSFHLTNFTNKNRNLKALKGLPKIWELFDIKNINRLKNTKDAVKLASNILYEIEKNINKDQQKQEDQQKEEQKKNSQLSMKNGKLQEDHGDSLPNLDPGNQLTKEEIKELTKAINKQKDFLNGKIEKEEISPELANKLKISEKSDSSYVDVAREYEKYSLKGDGVPKTKVLLIKNLTKSFIDSGLCPLTARHQQNSSSLISEGLRLGAILGKKLQVRNESKELVTTRQKTGKIDGRMMAELGFNNENVFYSKSISKFVPSIIHISVDASGSMQGPRWENALKMCTAMAKATSMIPNIDCVISFRGTKSSGWSNHGSVPVMLIAYDSRKDSINKISSLFPHITCPDSTPEGLCFESIIDLLPAGGSVIESYFINISDGEPAYSDAGISYGGEPAIKHTRKQVEKMLMKGIKVLSYFVGSSSSIKNFKNMYGKDAEFCSPGNMMEIARTMNKRFLSNPINIS